MNCKVEFSPVRLSCMVEFSPVRLSCKVEFSPVRLTSVSLVLRSCRQSHDVLASSRLSCLG